MTGSGTLYVIATPIGNLEDITLRSLRLLKSLRYFACEDTRTTRSLFQKLEIESDARFFSYHEHNEEQAAEKIVDLLREGQEVGLVSDAGMPGVSDPGYRAVSLAIAEGFKVEVCPGPSAVQTALVASGLPSSSYTFKSFPPRKEGKRRKFFEEEKHSGHTLIFFESKHRIIKTMESAFEVLGERRAVVCIELTKKFETIVRADLSKMAKVLEETDLRGEITALIECTVDGFEPEIDDESTIPVAEGEKKISKYQMKQMKKDHDEES